MKKKAQVVMLPDTGRDDLSILTRMLKLNEQRKKGIEYHHLYFTTDEEIKESDWVIYMYTNSLMKATRVNKDENYIFTVTDTGRGDLSLNQCRKIVATTNPDLNNICNNCGKDRGNMLGGSCDNCFKYHTSPLIAKIPTDFIEAYVKAQGSIKEVMLEYKSEYQPYWEHGEFHKNADKLTLKLNSDGTVIWHPIEESKVFTRQQVIDILTAYEGKEDRARAFMDKNYPE